MSTIVVLKEADTLILGTDSRYMASDFGHVVSDAEQKIFEIAPDTFIAPSGWKIACDFQVVKARELVRTLRTTDIRTLAKALATESLPHLEVLADRLRAIPHPHEKITSALEGQLTMHATVLAGRTADGELGYTSQVFRVQVGSVVCEADEYFGSEGRIYTTSGDPAMQIVREDSTILAGGPVEVVQKLLAALKAAWPTIGGENQLVQLTVGGTSWISRRPAEAPLAEGIADALFAGRATFAYNGGGKVTIDSGGLTLADQNVSPTATVTIASGGVTLAKGSNTFQITAAGFTLADSGGAFFSAAASELLLQKGASSVSIKAAGVTIAQGILTLDLNGVVTTLANTSLGGVTTGNGITIRNKSTEQQVVITPEGIYFVNAAGQLLATLATIGGTGIMQVRDPSTSALVQASSGPGAIIEVNPGSSAGALISVNGTTLTVP